MGEDKNNNRTHEIELRAVLSEEQFDKFSIELPKFMRLIKEETAYTRKFEKEQIDIRLRNSEDKFELVCKKGDINKTTRKEITVKLHDIEEIEKLSEIFEALELKKLPPWKTVRKDLEYEYNGENYGVSLQYIEHFAYILEIEMMSTEDKEKFHEKNIREIFESLKCEPVDKKDFMTQIKEYGKKNKV